MYNKEEARTMPIFPITLADLPKLEPLLRASFGETLDLADEIAYFPKPPQDWFFIQDSTGASVGLIRHFPLAEALYLGECYVKPCAERQRYLTSLFEHFCQTHRLPIQATIRFCALVSDQVLQAVLSELFPKAIIKTFLYFERALESS
jgi:hypothetical protein